MGFIDIVDGKISDLQLGRSAGNDACDKVTDCKGAVLAPGLVDMRVQSADPGAEHLESLSTLLAARRKAASPLLPVCQTQDPSLTRPVLLILVFAGVTHWRATLVGIWRRDQGLLGTEMAELD